MALPPLEEVRWWDVNQVLGWLARSGLTSFKSHFITDRIDGKKLIEMTPGKIDERYKNVEKYKRKMMIGHLEDLARSKPPVLIPGPQNYPGPGGMIVPQHSEDYESDGYCSSEFEEDEDYLEPTSGPLQEGGTGASSYPESEELYEVPYEEESQAEVREVKLTHRPSIVDSLKGALSIRRSTDCSPAAAVPPRPPRSNVGQSPASPAIGKRQPDPPPSVEQFQESDDVYEIPDDNHEEVTEVLKNKPTPTQRKVSTEPVLPPRPVKKTSTENAPLMNSATEKVPAKKVSTEKAPVKKVSTEKGPNEISNRTTQQGGFLFNSPQTASFSVNNHQTPSINNDDLTDYEWYHGEITREHATMILQREQKDGMFLVRKSDRSPSQPYTLVLWESRIWNLPIRKLDKAKFAVGKFKEGETQFSSIVQLVTHYKTVSLIFKTSADTTAGQNTLRFPAPKQ